MAAGTVSLSGNVFEMLIGHNYERWSVLMKNYLIGEGLWDVISCDDVGDDPDLWRKRNAKALFALQLSCGPDIFKTKSDVDSARDAWSRLISLGSDAKGIPLDLGFSDSYVHQGVKRGDLDVVNSILRSGNNEHRTTDASGKTVLHTAVIAGHEHIVEMLLAKIDLLEMRDNAGYTALALVAQLSGNTTMARLMVDRIPSLVDIQTLDYQSPLLLASGSGHKELTHYLASRTEVIEDPEIVAVLLSNCITAEIIDLVSLWISCRGRVRISPGSLHRVNRLRQGGYYRPAPLLALASMPSVFRSGCRLNE